MTLSDDPFSTTQKPPDAAPVLLMADPSFYAIEKPYGDGHAPANDFSIAGYEAYAQDPDAFVTKAKQQWSNLRDIFNALGVTTIVMPSDPANSDQVFTADPSLSLRKADGTLVTVFSRFSNEHRQAEVSDQKKIISSQKGRGRQTLQTPFRMEGTGDNVYDAFRDVFWSGYTTTPGRESAAAGRSDKRAHRFLKRATGVEVVSLEVRQPFFHIDTSLAPLPNGHILCYRGGMSDEAFEKMQQNAFDRFGLPREDFLIEVSAEDAAAYACNVRCIGDTIVMPECSQELQDTLAARGYTVLTADMSQFIQTGGAVHCLTNNLNETRVPGGMIRRQPARDLALTV